MAQLTKFKAYEVKKIINHNLRIRSTTNKDIDFSRTHLNYSLTPDRGMTDYEYYKQRLSEVYVFNRKDVVTAASWVVSLPDGVDDPETQRRFFEETYAFFRKRYGEENICQAIVHRDEYRKVAQYDRWSNQRVRDEYGNMVTQTIGKDHLHLLFLPVVPDPKPEHWELGKTERVNASVLLTKSELSAAQSDLMQHLVDHGLSECRVITGKSPKSYLSVEQLKRFTDMEQEIFALREQNTILQDRLREVDRDREERRGRW